MTPSPIRMCFIGHSRLSDRQAWDYRWRCNLWPLLPGRGLAASTTSALSCGVRDVASGPGCHPGSYWHSEPAPTWHTDTHSKERSPSPACYLPCFSHTNTWWRCTPWYSLHYTGPLLAWKEMKDDHFMWDLLLLFVCRAVSLFPLISSSYFPGHIDIDSGPDHMFPEELAEERVTPYGHYIDETVSWDWEMWLQ